MERATEFIQLYNQLSSRLSELAGGDRGIPFTTLADRVARGNSAVRAFLSELKDFAALRNAIVHNNGFPVRVIAEPSEGAQEPSLVFPTSPFVDHITFVPGVETTQKGFSPHLYRAAVLETYPELLRWKPGTDWLS